MKAMVYHGANDIRFEEKPANAVLATTAKSNSIHTAATAAGFWAT